MVIAIRKQELEINRRWNNAAFSSWMRDRKNIFTDKMPTSKAWFYLFSSQELVETLWHKYYDVPKVINTCKCILGHLKTLSSFACIETPSYASDFPICKNIPSILPQTSKYAKSFHIHLRRFKVFTTHKMNMTSNQN